MSFEAFCEIYTKDLKARLKESTWQTKENIIQKKLLPYFGKRKICEITTKDVIAWQNEMLAYRDKNHNAPPRASPRPARISPNQSKMVHHPLFFLHSGHLSLNLCRSFIFITPFMVLKHRTSIARF